MLPVKIVTRAASQIEQAARWWRKHRDRAPEAFKEELECGLTLISQEPSIGAKASNARLNGVQRVHLGRIRYYLYYRVQPKHVEVLAFWHSSRGNEPEV